MGGDIDDELADVLDVNPVAPVPVVTGCCVGSRDGPSLSASFSMEVASACRMA